MKFLVLALCVCAASAASFGAFTPFQRQAAKPAAVAKAVAKTPVRTVAKAAAVVATPAAAPVVQAPAPVVAAAEYVAPQAVAAAKTVAAPAYNTYDDAHSEVVRSENEIQADGYKAIYETSNGIVAESYGTLKKGADDKKFLTVQGAYRYLLADGTPVEVTYVADENGFQPESRFLPVAPPTPEAILRSLEYIATQPKYVEKEY